MSQNRRISLIAVGFGVLAFGVTSCISTKQMASAVVLAKTPHSCSQDLSSNDPKRRMGFAFTNVRAVGGDDPASYREYVCDNFTPGEPVTGKFSGSFLIDSHDVNGVDRKTGAGWIALQFRFTSTGSPLAEYDACYGATPTNTCFATGDPRTLHIPANGAWKDSGEASVTGFADGTGKAILRITAVKVEQVTSGPNVNHLISAAPNADAKVTITN